MDEGIPLDTYWDLVGDKWPTTLIGSSVKAGGVMALRWHPEIVGALGDDMELVKRGVEPRMGPFYFGYRGVVEDGGEAHIERVLLMREKVGGGGGARKPK
jgi:hypothetical protein